MEERDTLNEWPNPVGEMILSFGNLELAFLRLYQLNLRDRDYFEDSFDKRFDLLIGVLKVEGRPAEIVDAMIELKKLSETRHLVAHSALYIDIFQHPDNGQIFTEDSITDSRDRQKRVTLPRLRELSENARSLVAEIHSHFAPEFWAVEDRRQDH